jgi:hypothetical protein
MSKEKKGKLVHTRKMEINTYDLGDHRVMVEGKLTDTRTPIIVGDQPDPPFDLVHDLIARIWVQGPDLTISAAEGEMKHIPRELCYEVLPGIKNLVGLKIVSGFTQKVKTLMGGVKGCSHLANLFLTLGPVAVQGYWAAYGRTPETRTIHNPVFNRIINSCYVWRKDGPLVRSRAKELGIKD